MRDPLDTILSCYTHKFEDTGATWATHSDRLALEYAVYLEVMQHYREMLPNRVTHHLNTDSNDSIALFWKVFDISYCHPTPIYS